MQIPHEHDALLPAGADRATARDELFTAATAAVRWLERHDDERIATYIPDTAREDFDEFGFDPIRPQAIVVGDLGERWDFKTLNRAFRTRRSA